MKKNVKSGIVPIHTAVIIPITNGCGSPGCASEIKQYTMPYAGTQEDFQRHYEEKFKTFKQAA